ncbi:hypothetical protein JVU11DRAFT_5950 [Chiua virens]|nr:hypothetical protein JVU11DRAFT_5950 [Chiua virens]
MARKLGTRAPRQLPHAGQLHMSSPSRRSFGVPNAPGIQQVGEISDGYYGQLRRASSWVRPNILSRLMNQDEELDVKPQKSDKAAHSECTARQGARFDPTASVIYDCVVHYNARRVLVCKRVNAVLALHGFNEFQEESDIAFYTGILVAAFFLTQFLTSLLWATVADKHGPRTVLFLALFGSTVTVSIFGTCTSFRQAFVVRLLQGIFAGAVGVARGCVTTVTDPTNEGRAYAIMGFCWGFGGVAGAVVGGACASPHNCHHCRDSKCTFQLNGQAEKWPQAFGSIPFFVDYPYFLPCAIAGSMTLIGSILSLFLGRDGGPREGAIRLPPEKVGNQPLPIPEEEEEERRASTYPLKKCNPQDCSVPSSGKSRVHSRHRLSRANGSAYGYGDNQRHRLANTITPRRSMASTLRSRRSAYMDGNLSSYEGSELNFTQRLLMANENAVTNIADLWVAAAMNVDNEEEYALDSGMLSDEEQGVLDGEEDIEGQDFYGTQCYRKHGRRSSRGTFASARGIPRRSVSRTSAFGSPIPGSVRLSRRSSTTGPSIFAHAGVRMPPAVLDAQLREAERPDGLTPILERHGSPNGINGTETGAMDVNADKPPSLTSQLPILVIIQYGLLALHSTTHDQVFLSYLVTDYGSGGLNLNPGHFSQLIALMCLFQIVYQFYLYPNIGHVDKSLFAKRKVSNDVISPPRGRFSHLAMFRLGSFLFIPAYLTVVLYRVFANTSDGGNFLLMSGSAVRYCGNTFAYTSVAILLNYMTPPAAVGFANGAAQSIVSLARCFGPILGGYKLTRYNLGKLWAASTQSDPSGYPLGFLACSLVCALAVAHSFLIR